MLSSFVGQIQCALIQHLPGLRSWQTIRNWTPRHIDFGHNYLDGNLSHIGQFCSIHGVDKDGLVVVVVNALLVGLCVEIDKPGRILGRFPMRQSANKNPLLLKMILVRQLNSCAQLNVYPHGRVRKIFFATNH
jgi:hypothetical protein